MAKQGEGLQLEGTIGWVTFYQLNGKYYARRRSKLARKTVKYSPRFEKTRQYASWLGKASSITASIYRSLPKERQVYALYCELKSLAYGWLKEGITEEEIKGKLEESVKPGEEKKKALPVGRKGKKVKAPVAKRLFVSLPVERKMMTRKRTIPLQRTCMDSS